MEENAARESIEEADDGDEKWGDEKRYLAGLSVLPRRVRLTLTILVIFCFPLSLLLIRLSILPRLSLLIRNTTMGTRRNRASPPSHSRFNSRTNLTD